MRVPDVEVLWWEGCPSTDKALSELRAALRELGLDPGVVRSTEMRTDEQAQQARFVGSPTILIDGADVQPPGDDPVGLSCRLYKLRDGRISPTPDPEDVRAALASAVEGVDPGR
jgi:hypothetical protein